MLPGTTWSRWCGTAERAPVREVRDGPERRVLVVGEVGEGRAARDHERVVAAARQRLLGLGLKPLDVLGEECREVHAAAAFPHRKQRASLRRPVKASAPGTSSATSSLQKQRPAHGRACSQAADRRRRKAWHASCSTLPSHGDGDTQHGRTSGDRPSPWPRATADAARAARSGRPLDGPQRLFRDLGVAARHRRRGARTRPCRGRASEEAPPGPSWPSSRLLGLVLWFNRRGAPAVAARLLAFSLPVVRRDADDHLGPGLPRRRRPDPARLADPVRPAARSRDARRCDAADVSRAPPRRSSPKRMAGCTRAGARELRGGRGRRRDHPGRDEPRRRTRCRPAAREPRAAAPPGGGAARLGVALPRARRPGRGRDRGEPARRRHRRGEPPRHRAHASLARGAARPRDRDAVRPRRPRARSASATTSPTRARSS